MKHSLKIIRKKDGGVEVKLSFSFTPEEVEAVSRIPDDPNVSFDTLRRGGPDPETKIDFFLCYLRILIHWVFIFNDKDRAHMIINSRPTRKFLEGVIKKKRRKRK